ncbi:MAG TPA: hypothetical protein GX717_01485, partial [Clostridiaceae bacterium]|nr:hypothetical protein [Clostridiaceae bacterium]
NTYYFLLGLLTTIFIGYAMFYVGELLPVPRWPQMTNGPAFSIGIMYVCAWIVILMNATKHSMLAERLQILSFMSLLLVVLTIAGSNTMTKHVVLAMWLIAPITMYVLKQLLLSDQAKTLYNKLLARFHFKVTRKTMVAVLLLFAIMFNIPFVNMLSVTANYDTTDLSRLTHTVNNPKVRFNLTTAEEAYALNGLMEAMDSYNKGTPLIVFGSSLLFYYLTDHPAYVMPWITAPGYSDESFAADLADADERYNPTRPLIIWCRTDYSRGFTSDSDLLNELYSIERNRPYGEKRSILFDYLAENNYGVRYFNDYYFLLVPDFSQTEEEILGMVNVMNYHAAPENIWHYGDTDERQGEQEEGQTEAEDSTVQEDMSDIEDKFDDYDTVDPSTQDSFERDEIPNENEIFHEDEMFEK